jgi:dephospho-CoA kinase
MKVIGLVGELASGKNEVAKKLLKNLNSQSITLSDILRQVALEEGEPHPDRQYLQDLGDRLRQEFGGQILVELAMERAIESDLLIIIGIRNPVEAECVKKNGGDIVAIRADQEVRFQRMLKRGRSDDPKTWEEFLEMEQRDLNGGREHGQRVADCLVLADITLYNNSEALSVSRELEVRLRPEF